MTVSFKYIITQPQTTTFYSFTYNGFTNQCKPKRDLKVELSESINALLDALIDNVNAFKTLYLLQASLPEDKKLDQTHFINCISQEVLNMEQSINNDFALLGYKAFRYAKDSFYLIFNEGEEYVRSTVLSDFEEAYDNYMIRFMAC
jgi:hypothetical protein